MCDNGLAGFSSPKRREIILIIIKEYQNMGKFSGHAFLSKQQVNELFVDFAKSFASLKTSIEAANYIRDLLSEQEVIMLARRLQIARLLNNGLTYYQIRKAMKVSDNTIAKVHTWLKLYGDGYRLVLTRTGKEGGKDKIYTEWSKVKRKYPLYFWPELLLKEIIKAASNRERQRMLSVINQMKEKTKISREILSLLK